MKKYRQFLTGNCNKYRFTMIPSRLPLFHACSSFDNPEFDVDRVIKFAIETMNKIEAEDGFVVRFHISQGTGLRSVMFQSETTSRGNIVPSLLLFGKIMEEHIVLITKPVVSAGPGYRHSTMICHPSFVRQLTWVPAALEKPPFRLAIESKFNYARIFFKLPESIGIVVGGGTTSREVSSIPLPISPPPNTVAVTSGGCVTESSASAFRHRVVIELEKVMRNQACIEDIQLRTCEPDFALLATDLVESYTVENAHEVMKSLEKLLEDLRRAISTPMVTASSAIVEENRRILEMKRNQLLASFYCRSLYRTWRHHAKSQCS
jgi:hypothetical protein